MKHSLTFYIWQQLNNILCNYYIPRRNIKKMRANLAKIDALLPKGHPPVTITHLENDQVKGDWIEPKKRPSERTLLYLHGGGYALGATASHEIFVNALCYKVGINVLALDYPLSPEHPFPAALESAYAAYKWLLSKGIDPKNIVIGGDSAGGGLTLALVLYLKQKNEPLPNRLILLSPYVDLTPEVVYPENILKKDVVLRVLLSSGFLAKAYAPNQDLHNPLISPLFGDFTGAPPTLMFTGTAESFITEDLALAERLKNQKVPLKHIIGEGMFHIWPILLPPFAREAKEAMNEIKNFLNPL
ncbi:MAG: alpha/beta hydrolase [Verrucomicrobia bacterium]|nr:alpha/beta hydrolase [Verrucomicrobiota bacterium]